MLECFLAIMTDSAFIFPRVFKTKVISWLEPHTGTEKSSKALVCQEKIKAFERSLSYCKTTFLIQFFNQSDFTIAHNSATIWSIHHQETKNNHKIEEQELFINSITKCLLHKPAHL